MLKLKIILGSTRPNRFSEKVLPWTLEEAKKNGNFDIEVLDLRDYPLPFFDQQMPPSQVKDGQYGNDIARAWAAKIADADAFLVITPEYSHSVPAVLKNAYDTVYAEWHRKAIGFVSYGSVAGGRSVEHQRQIAVELQMAPVRPAAHIHMFWTLLDEAGQLKSGALDQFAQPLQNTLAEISWWGEALKAARAKQ